jgi:hypothetical protein
MLIRLSMEEREAILASMPRCNEWVPAAVLAAPEVAASRVDKDLTMAQRSHLITRLLVAQEAIEEDEGPDALVRHPQWCLRPSHLASPGASAPRALHMPFPRKARSRAPRAGTTWSGTASWTRLGKLHGFACTFFSPSFLSGSLNSHRILVSMQQGPFPGTLSQAGLGKYLRTMQAHHQEASWSPQ